jgi:hypothetical protein
MDQPVEGSAAGTLDEITVGARMLLLNLHRKITGAKEALEKGDFLTAQQIFVGAATECSYLAHAEAHLGVLGKGTIIPVTDAQEGMELVGFGVIADIRDFECENCTLTHRILTFADGSHIEVTEGQELIMVDDRAS